MKRTKRASKGRRKAGAGKGSRSAICHGKSKVRMETYLLELEWSCPICGTGNVCRN